MSSARRISHVYLFTSSVLLKISLLVLKQVYTCTIKSVPDKDGDESYSGADNALKFVSFSHQNGSEIFALFFYCSLHITTSMLSSDG